MTAAKRAAGQDFAGKFLRIGIAPDNLGGGRGGAGRGTTNTARGVPDRASWCSRPYKVDSQKKMADAARAAGATVLMTNHTEFDRAYTKARLISATREAGENHPFVVGADGVQRYFTVMIEGATASKLRAAAKS